MKTYDITDQQYDYLFGEFQRIINQRFFYNDLSDSVYLTYDEISDICYDQNINYDKYIVHNIISTLGHYPIYHEDWIEICK